MKIEITIKGPARPGTKLARALETFLTVDCTGRGLYPEDTRCEINVVHNTAYRSIKGERLGRVNTKNGGIAVIQPLDAEQAEGKG